MAAAAGGSRPRTIAELVEDPWTLIPTGAAAACEDPVAAAVAAAAAGKVATAYESYRWAVCSRTSPRVARLQLQLVRERGKPLHERRITKF